MKVNFNVPIRALNGQQMAETGYLPLAANVEQEEGKKYVTAEDGTVNEQIVIRLLARHFVVNALATLFTDEPNVGEKEKYERYNILKKIEASKDLEGDEAKVQIDSTEAVVIRHVVGKKYDPWIVGQIIDIVEGN